MIIDIPHQDELKILNKGDLKGSIKETFNIDLERFPNKICLPNKTVLNENDTSLPELGLITKFVFFEGVYHAHSAGTDSGTYDSVGKVLRGGDSVDNGFFLPTWTGNTTDYESDATIEAFNGELVLMSQDFWSITSGSDTSWTAEATSDSCEGISTKFGDRVYFKGGGVIKSFANPATVASSGSYTFRLPKQSEGDISGIDTAKNGIWIATSSDGSPETFVYLWDGVTENVYEGVYKIPEPYLMNLKVLNDIPYVVGGTGRVYAFNGSFFEEVERFPFGDILLAGLDDSASVDISTSGISKWIHNNGSTVLNNKLYFLVNPVAQDDSLIFGDYSKLAGIWCLDPEIGLYHKHAITVSATNGEMGMLKHVGALTTSGLDSDYSPSDAGSLIFGFSYLTENSTSTEKYAIGYISPYTETNSTATGYIVTNRIYAQNIQDTWEKVALGFEDMNANDSVIIKYRTTEKDGLNAGITWVNTTSFTSTTSGMATVKTNFDAGIGYESRILYGQGAGVISQITNITENAGTYTITVDTAHAITGTPTAVARLENWNKVDTITSADNNLQFKQIPIGKESNWIQYKFVLNGTEVALNKHNPVINRIVSVSNQHTKFQ